MDREAAALRLALVTGVAFAAVVVAAVAGGVWAAVVVAAVAVAAAAYVARPKPKRVLRTAPAHVGPANEHRLLLLATEPPAAGALAGIRADRVLVVVPAAARRLETVASDTAAAEARARACAETTAAALRERAIDATSSVGDASPLRALEDALRTFGGDEIAVATGSDELANAIRERFALPVTRLVA